MIQLPRFAARVRSTARVLANTFLLSAVVVATDGFTAASLRAQSIVQTSNGLPLYGFGPEAVPTVGQTFVATGTNLADFSFWLSNDGLGTTQADALQLRGYLMAWDGSQAVGPVLYASDTRVGPTLLAQQYQFITSNLTLSAGAQYVAFLSVSEFIAGISPADASAAFIMSDDAGSGGELVFAFNGDDFPSLTTTPWTTGNGEQLQFEATFNGTVVPEPATVLLLGCGVFIIGAVRARRRDA